MQVLINSLLDDIRDIKSLLFVLTRGKIRLLRNDVTLDYDVMLRNNLSLVYYISLLRNVCNLHNWCELKYFFLDDT